MNRWKIAFWICFLTLIATLAFGLYSILDQGVTITHQKDSYIKTESDLNVLVAIANKSHLTKDELLVLLTQTGASDDFLIKNDTLYLNRLEFVLDDSKLTKVNDSWK